MRSASRMMICLGLGKKVRTVVRSSDFAASKADVVLADMVTAAVVRLYSKEERECARGLPVAVVTRSAQGGRWRQVFLVTELLR